jgi:hypothetical protein
MGPRMSDGGDFDNETVCLASSSDLSRAVSLCAGTPLAAIGWRGGWNCGTNDMIPAVQKPLLAASHAWTLG